MSVLPLLRFDTLLSLLGRLAICYLFVSAAYYHLTFGWDLTIQDMVAHQVLFPQVMNVIAMLTSAGLALALLFNIKPRWSALGLALYVGTVSLVMYGPFNADWNTTRVLFMKDMAIFGALLCWSATLARPAR